MKLKITQKQLDQIFESVNDSKIICDNCGWSWKKSEGGKDMYVCHKCGNNNDPKKSKSK